MKIIGLGTAMTVMHEANNYTSTERLDVAEKMSGWHRAGKGIALYRNEDLGHHDQGLMQALTFGDEDCQVTGLQLPDPMPDFPTQINWRYRLWAIVPSEEQR